MAVITTGNVPKALMGGHHRHSHTADRMPAPMPDQGMAAGGSAAAAPSMPAGNGGGGGAAFPDPAGGAAFPQGPQAFPAG